MSYRLVRHPEVADDLYYITVLIADYAGSKVALRKLNEIEQAVNNLRSQPHIVTIRNEISPNLRVIPVARKGVITFTVDDEQKIVYIVSITYAGGNWEKLLSDRQ
jgi:toxin ParE1/3/4